MLRLWVKDNTDGKVHEYGTNKHDSLVLQEDGSLHYENIQCCVGTKFAEEGYSFCREDGTVPDTNAVDTGDEYLDIGGCFFEQQPATDSVERTKLKIKKLIKRKYGDLDNMRGCIVNGHWLSVAAIVELIDQAAKE